MVALLNGVVAVLSLLACIATGNSAWLVGTALGVLTVGLLMYFGKKQEDARAAEDKPATDDISKNAEPVPNNQDNIRTLSHHIRTPLSNIVGIANVLSGDFDPNNKKTLVDSLVASVETITDLFDMINGEAAGKPFGIDIKDKSRMFDLRSLITQTAELTPGVEVKLEVYGELPRLKGNSVKMRRIILTIFDFFLHYTPKEDLPAQVTVVVNRVRIPITPIKYRFDVKSEFGVSVDANAEITELNIAKRLIEELGGNIKYRFDGESTFIYFNVCFDGVETVKPDNVNLAAASSSKKIEVYTKETVGFTDVAKAKNLEDANIIVCDDNPINQKVMSLSLDKYVKTITLASNGQECVDMVANGRYDLILMDIQMPVLDGYEATKQIRILEQTTNAHIPIVAVTANTMSGDRQQCLSIGMDDYVSKPFQIEDVLHKMRDLLAKPVVK
ncbi:MAG: response regulator [Bacteroidales bacterium]|nr:response regulator [Bacteroidales bacterium]